MARIAVRGTGWAALLSEPEQSLSAPCPRAQWRIDMLAESDTDRGAAVHFRLVVASLHQGAWQVLGPDRNCSRTRS